MLKKVSIGAGAVIVVLMAAILLWAIRPWVPYEPGRWYLSYPPMTRAYSFSNWDKIAPYKTLKASATPRQYERDILSLENVSIKTSGGEFKIAQYLEDAGISGLMVLQDGKVRFEYYAKGVQETTKYHLWSATKSYTSTLIGMALYQGVIESIDDPIKKYAPQFANTAYADVSIRHVLMMSSGVDFVHSADTFGVRQAMYQSIFFDGENLDDYIKNIGRRVPAGTDFNYAATDTHVLGAVLRGAYNMPLAEIATENLWKPGGFNHDAIWSENFGGSDQVAIGQCCLAVTLTDFAHLGQIHLEGLVFDGEQTVPEDWIERVENAQAPFQEPQIHEPSGRQMMGYSYQFWLPENYDQEFVARGALGQYLWVDRKRGFVVAQFAINSGDPEVYPAAMRAIGDAVAGPAEDFEPASDLMEDSTTSLE